MKKLISALLLLAASWLFAWQPAQAAEDGVQNKSKGYRFSKLAQNGSVNRTLVNVGQVAMWIYSDGESAIGPDDNSGLYFPRGQTITAAIFQDGFIWGGRVNDGSTPVVRVGGQTYSIGTVPGTILSPGVAEDVNDRENVDRLWRVRRDYATAELTQDAAEINFVTASAVTQAQIDEVREQYAEDWKDWPWQKGAPWTGVNDVQDGGYLGAKISSDPDSFEVVGAGNGVLDRGEDANSNGILDVGEDVNGNKELDGEVPGIGGADQVVWLVANDLSSGPVTTLYGSPSIGFEMQCTLWAYRRSDALGNIIFKQFRIIYKGTATTPANATIDSTYFCQWSDPDLGSAGDDLAGCDTTKGASLGFVYNAVSTDGNYAQVGLPPPASGYDFFAGPLVPDPEGSAIFGLKRRAGFRNLPMSSFAYFAAGQTDSDPDRGGDYNGTLQWWNLLRAFRPRPENPPDPWRDPDGNRTYFRVPGDPVAGTGWTDANPGDRRILLVSGPFTMARGDTQETVVAVMAGLGSDRLSSISVLKFVDRFAQDAFDNLFELPKAPPSPVVSATEFNGQILLNWGESVPDIAKTENTVQKGYAFEGYNVYQLPNAGAPISQGILLATYDLVNEITTIRQETFDQRSGQILDLPVQLGKNTAISRTYVAERDRFREANLANGQTYYFGVTAYNYNPDPTIKTLESTPSVVTVVPQSTKPGVRYQLDSQAHLEAVHVGPSDGKVTPIVVDPSKTVDASYQVSFDDNGWTLTNTTSGKVLLTGQQNQSGDGDYLITEGLQVVVEGPPVAGLSFVSTGPRWVTGGNHGGDTFFGGAFLGVNFNGSNLAPADYRTIRVDFFAKESFTDLNGNGSYDIGEPYQLPAGAGQLANRYRGFALGAHLGQTQVPFRAFDIEVDPPRQLDIIVRDRDQNGQWDLHKLYDPADPNFVNVNNGDFQFNYIYILNTDYDPTGNRWNPNAGGEDFMVGHLDATNGGPVQWNLWLDQRGSNEPLGGNFSVTFVAPNVNTAADQYTFTSKGSTYSDATAKADLDLVNVFPNPYLGFNRAELNRISRYVTFSHLPPKATIRIFTLAGVLVRTIEKNDNAQFTRWDLQNERNLPAASGIYIAHVEFPDLNETKVLKLALVREEQFLRNY